MAHYVLYRQDTDGDGYPEYIANITTMTITEDPWQAQQYDDRDLSRIDVNFLARHYFFPVGITQLGLRIQPHLAYHPPLAGLFNLLTPPPRRPRPVARPAMAVPPRPPRAPRAPRAAAPRPAAPVAPGRAPVRPAAPARPAAGPARPVAGPARPVGPVGPGPKGPGRR